MFNLIYSTDIASTYVACSRSCGVQYITSGIPSKSLLGYMTFFETENKTLILKKRNFKNICLSCFVVLDSLAIFQKIHGCLCTIRMNGKPV